MRSRKMGLVVAVMSLVLFFGQWAQAATRITLGGGAPGGTYYQVMAAMAKVLEDKSGDIRPAVETTSGSAHALRLVNSGELTIGSGLLDTAARAWNGQREFKQKLGNLRSVMAFIDIGDAFLVRKDSNITKATDLKGKKIGVPSPAGLLALQSVLKSHGLNPSDYTTRFLSYTAQGNALKDKSIHAGYMVVHRINRTVMEFMTTMGGRIVGFENQKAINYFETHFPVWRSVMLKANTYPGQNQAIPVAGRHGLVVTHKDTSADLIYKVVKTLYANHDALKKIHPAAAMISLEQTKRYYEKKLFVVPIHPGAERYLKEVGVLK
ncbi:MAG: TAXI family TRAP transporter solute-binding subunit [bacterium]|nr:TAXI family TRAP transporter solute-binding subunit [bacterium]